METKKRTILAVSLFACLSLLMTSCTHTSNSSTTTLSSSGSSRSQPATTSVDAVTVKLDSEDYYFDWKNQSHKTIDISSGSQTITSSGIYEITGTLNNGSLTVNVDKQEDKGIVYLVLNNVSVSSSTSAPVYIKDAKKVVLILENGTTNKVYQGSSVTTDDSGNPSSAIFSTADLTITGGGTLHVTSDYNDGITSKDKLKITDGTITIQSKQDGMIGKDLLAVENAAITITAGKDGMRSTNDTDADMGNLVIMGGTFNITANNDGLQAYALLQIDGGTFTVTTGGGYTGITKTNTNGMPNNQNTQKTTSTDSSSYKGLKSTESILINGGTFVLSCKDDAVHSSGDVTISGGSFTIKTGDDGIHSDTNVVIGGGEITINNSYEAIEGKNITVNSGKISITSSDDGFNVNDSSGTLTFNGGDCDINAGGDGVDSNFAIIMTGGTVTVSGPTENNNGAIDYEKTFTISGGTIIAAGSSGMAEAPSSGSQSSMLMYFTSSQSAETKITLKDNSGNTVAEYTPSKVFSSIAVSTPALTSGSSYTLYTNDTKVVTFTLSGTTTYVNESGITAKQGMGGGNAGGFGGRGGR